jgi:hypothetical protein
MRTLVVTALVLTIGCGSDKPPITEPPRNEARSTEPAPAPPVRQSDIDTTTLTIKKLAFEAYPAWAASHPDKQCPDKIEELLEFIDRNNTMIDPWGRPLRMMCGPSLPPGVKDLAVMSLGADGKAGTADDLKSWE